MGCVSILSAFHTVLHSTAGKAALIGMATAAQIDYHAFTTFKSIKEFESYSWKIAAFRWAQGLVIGLVGGSALANYLG